ncbi:hypothetical protein JL720_10284 [Aureococcus anophagefferens]|nr:hypothetical protein JL720_10284 [Aureococcus anophagefferens]
MRTRCWLLALVAAVGAAKKRRKKPQATESGLATVSVGDTGLVVRISDGPASASLKSWAKDLGDGGATFSEATSREAAVAARVSAGEWPASSYDEYQRLAAGTGNVDSAGLLISYGVGQTVAEYADSEPLLRAVAEQDAAATRRLLDDGADADGVVPDGTTALHAAALVGCAACAGLLLDNSRDADALLEAVGASGMTAVHVAAGAGHAETLSLLVRRGGDLGARHAFANTTALHMAAENGFADVVETACALGADPDAATALGGRPLHAAAQRDRAACAAALLAAPCGADSETLLNGDTTALYIAAQEGFAETVTALAAAGASTDAAVAETFDTQTSRDLDVAGGDATRAFLPNTEPANGATPLHAAAENGHAAAARALLDAGAAVDAGFSMVGVSPLHLAAQYDRPDVAALLLDRGAAVDARSLNADGASALYYAAGAGFRKVVDVLLARGADADAGQRRSGASPLLVAAGAGHLAIVTRLLAAGAAVSHARTTARRLSVAASQGHLDILTALLAKGAPTAARSGADGQTPLHLAVGGDPKLIDALVKAGADAGRDGGRRPARGAAPRGEERQRRGRAGSAQGRRGRRRALRRGHARRDGALRRRVGGAFGAAVALLDAGADPDAALDGPSRDTPLLAAVNRGDAPLVRALLSAETEPPAAGPADPDLGSAASSLHQSPILLAVVRGHADVAAALLDAGCNCGVLVATSRDPAKPPDNLLDIARARRDFDMLNLLAARGDDCDVRMED